MYSGCEKIEFGKRGLAGQASLVIPLYTTVGERTGRMPVRIREE